MAVPPDHYRFLSNTIEAERLAQLGWVSEGQARAAIDEATRRAKRQEDGDALKVLEELGLLDGAAKQGLDRDQARPTPWWKFWGARPYGPPPTGDASFETLLDELYEASGSQGGRARYSLMEKVKGDDAARQRFFAALLAFQPRSTRVPCPLNSFLVDLNRNAIDIPTDVQSKWLQRAADDYLKKQLQEAWGTPS